MRDSFILMRLNLTQQMTSFLYSLTSEKRTLRVRIFTFFIAVTFENYKRYFFYKILVLIKSKNINVVQGYI